MTSTARPPMTAARLRRARRRLRARHAAAVAGWTLACLAAFDVAANRLFPPPPVDVKPEQVPRFAIRSYLDYGRSTEGKLARMVAPTDAKSAPLVPVGWVDDGAAHPNVIGPRGTPRLTVAFFGMSFSNHVAHALADRVDPTVRAVLYAGPSAPPNHSFAQYTAARRLPAAPKADVVVFGILASSVKGMTTMTGLTWMFESPAPYCYPRYTLDAAGRLVETWPTIRTEADLRAALADPAKLAAFRADLAAHDRFYDPFAFRANVLDRSALARLVRRAWADRNVTDGSASVDRPKLGFDPTDPEVGPPLRAMCRQFAATARADGRRPVVLLIQDQGSKDDLDQLLARSLDDDGIPRVSTTADVATDDRTNFIPDGHFTPAADDRVARRLLAVIDGPSVH